MFEIIGWVFAAFVCVVWFIVCIAINSNWCKQSEKMLQTYSDLFNKLHDDYSDLCKRQSDEWHKLSTQVLKEAIEEMRVTNSTFYPEYGPEALSADEQYYPEEYEDDAASADEQPCQEENADDTE